MSIQSWDESPAGLLAQRAAFPGDDRLARLEAAELDRQEARSAWEARLAADPGWQADRQRQLAVAAHIVGRGQVINIGAVVPPELAPLYRGGGGPGYGQSPWQPAAAARQRSQACPAPTRRRTLSLRNCSTSMA